MKRIPLIQSGNNHIVFKSKTDGKIYGSGKNWSFQLLGTDFNYLFPEILSYQSQSISRFFSDKSNSSIFITDQGRFIGAGLKNAPKKIFEVECFYRKSVEKVFVSFNRVFVSIKEGIERTIYAFGDNVRGEIGLNIDSFPTISYLAPMKVSFPKRIITNNYEIQTGDYHSVIRIDSDVFSTGDNDLGEAGLGEIYAAQNFKKIKVFSQIEIKKISCGATNTLFLTELGKVFQCGIQFPLKHTHDPTLMEMPHKKTPEEVIIKDSPKIEQIFSSVCLSVLMTKDQDFYFYGTVRNGSLGFLENYHPYSKHKIKIPIKFNGRKYDFVHYIGGSYHNIFVTRFGHLYGNGCNFYGQLMFKNTREQEKKLVRLDEQICFNYDIHKWFTSFTEKIKHNKKKNVIIMCKYY